ncbi:MAG: extracellular solute-binding protein [Pseudomonadota bacterium]
MTRLTRGLLAGAGLSIVGAGAAFADAELVFRYAYDNVDEIRAGLDAFEEQNPGVTVELQRIAFKDARDQFIREAATGGGPDVVHLAFVWIKDLGTAEACMELSEVVAEKGIGANGWEDYIASDLTYNAEGDEFYGVPFATDTWAMVYNTEILDEAGVEKVPETWDELLEMARQVKAETGKTGLGFSAGASGANTIWFLANFKWWSEGGSLVVDDENGGYKLGIEPEHVAETIDYWKTYLDEDLTTSGSLGLDAWNAPEVLEPMIRGESAATIVPVFTAVQMFDDWKARNPGEELPFTTAMTPHGSDGKPTTHLGGQSLCVNANTEHP